MFDWLAKKFNASTDELLASSISKLFWLVLIGAGLWFAFRDKLSARFWLGYLAGGAVLFAWFSRNNAPDPVFTVRGPGGDTRTGTLSDIPAGDVLRVPDWRSFIGE